MKKSISIKRRKRGYTTEDNITEINKNTFWDLIAQAKQVCGQDTEAAAQWLEHRLLKLGPESALAFHDIVHAYGDLANKYGLWTAAEIMNSGCSDDGFIDFRAWLIAQGKEVYLAALKDPDSLADVELDSNPCFESLNYIGDHAYEKLTGRSAYDDSRYEAYSALCRELKKEIRYGDGIGYPYEWNEVQGYLPRLCDKYMEPNALDYLADHHRIWNPNSQNIQQARKNAKHKKKSDRTR